MTHKQISGIVGCSAKTVQRVTQELKRETSDCATKLEEYQRIFRRSLPIAERAKLLVKIAKENDCKAPLVSLKSLQRLDDLDGIVTPKDETRLRCHKDEPPNYSPMFIMPAGSRIAVTRQMPAPPSQEVKMIDGVVEGRERDGT